MRHRPHRRACPGPQPRCPAGDAGVLVAFDPDQAGCRAAVRAYHLLTQVTDGLAHIALPPGQDPAQILADHGPRHLAAILATRDHPLADLVTDAEVEKWARWLDHAEGQVTALRAAAPVIAGMPPAHVARQVARLSDRLGLDYATVTEAVTSAVPEVIRRASRRPADAAAGSRRPHDDSAPRAHARDPCLTSSSQQERARPVKQQPAASREPPTLADRTTHSAAVVCPRSTYDAPRSAASPGSRPADRRLSR